MDCAVRVVANRDQVINHDQSKMLVEMDAETFRLLFAGNPDRIGAGDSVRVLPHIPGSEGNAEFMQHCRSFVDAIWPQLISGRAGDEVLKLFQSAGESRAA